MINDDYTEDDRYDWDRTDPDQHCKHGTFIGSWWGPDLMCWACEQGLTDAEYRAYCLNRTRRELQERIHRIWPWEAMPVFALVGWSQQVLDHMFAQAEQNAEYLTELFARLAQVNAEIATTKEEATS